MDSRRCTLFAVSLPTVTHRYDPTGSSADPIVGQFAVAYHDEAASLGIDLNDLYSAMLADGLNTPLDWDIEGRQADAYMCDEFRFVSLRDD